MNICKEFKVIDILSVETEEESKAPKVPSSKALQDNFKKFCSFLDDSTFDVFTASEIGENFARVMIICDDVTLFNFKLYGVILGQHQQKKSKAKSKSKQGKNNLPEIFMYTLNYACIYLRAFIKKNKPKAKFSEVELGYLVDRNSSMDLEVLEAMSTILSTYNIDDPIVEPTLKLFEVLDFSDKVAKEPNEDLAKSVLDSVNKLFDREVNPQGANYTLRK